MFRIIKVLNHNGIIATDKEAEKQYILLGKGIGFGKKVNERIIPSDDCHIYHIQKENSKGSSKEIIDNIEPKFLEIANNIIMESEKEFGEIDRNILCPLADHIAFAVKRIKNNEEILNPLNSEIKALFADEYKVAYKAKYMIEESEKIKLSEDEIGYIALHIHSSLGSDNVSQAMKMASLVKECISIIENHVGRKVDVNSLGYNRLVSHVKYMIARTLSGETIQLDMNEYIQEKFSKSFILAKYVCSKIGLELNKELKDVEIGYLAMHIERVFSEELL
ncbi:MAG: PRD domain-containing protein [Clostridium sp.]|uniref:PRD domain-containing protein n=1 Tax=Clostridium sp. DSM 8431 TaxID=1761781 RepID=UPI0008ED104D|nr:PRD domain-containing protein [Clostridium sp. DSM 8431]MCR4945006.1 PRD domain-containing protein [Clostridium sp.]SFU78219.1 transcriptional antiterminator, BglG family [Clostridium sp. DSM 8431]